MKLISFILLSTILTSCAGYRYRAKDNPFAQFGIKTISIPMFYNHSNIANIQSDFTKEIFNTMVGYRGLDLHSGKQRTDAVLIGVIESEDKMSVTKTTDVFKTVKNSSGKNFYVPSLNKQTIRLRIIVLKQPTDEEIKFFTKGISKKAVSSKVIFNELIELSAGQALKSFGPNEAAVIGSQNRGLSRRSIELLAKSAATTFKDMILYAF